MKIPDELLDKILRGITSSIIVTEQGKHFFKYDSVRFRLVDNEFEVLFYFEDVKIGYYKFSADYLLSHGSYIELNGLRGLTEITIGDIT